MKPINRATPFILLALLGGGFALFFTPFPHLIGVAYLLFVAGLLLSLFDFFHAIATLSNAEDRRRMGVKIPLLTILIALGAWAMIINWGIQAKRLMDKRAQYELEHWEELHGTKEFQQADAVCPPQSIETPDP